VESQEEGLQLDQVTVSESESTIPGSECIDPTTINPCIKIGSAVYVPATTTTTTSTSTTTTSTTTEGGSTTTTTTENPFIDCEAQSLYQIATGISYNQGIITDFSGSYESALDAFHKMAYGTYTLYALHGTGYYIFDGFAVGGKVAIGDGFCTPASSGYYIYSYMQNQPIYHIVNGVITEILSSNLTTTTTTESTISIIAQTYGYLYNWYAATDPANIAASGWRVPSNNDFATLITYTGNSGQNLMAIGNTYWYNSIGLDTYGFNLRGAGQYENSNNVFASLGAVSTLWTTNTFGTNAANVFAVYNNGTINNLLHAGYYKQAGLSIRVMRNTTAPHGTVGTYTGNDGRVYPTIVIGTQEWISENLLETKYRNGAIISEIPCGPAWNNITMGARYFYVI
jgi:uncharacterized protein (TIGR02145 family)